MVPSRLDFTLCAGLLARYWVGRGLRIQTTSFTKTETIRLVAGTPRRGASTSRAPLWSPSSSANTTGALSGAYLAGLINHRWLFVIPGIAMGYSAQIMFRKRLQVANDIYTMAKPDGLTIGSIQPALYFDQLVGRKEVQFDWKKFTWIGNTTVSDYLLYMRSDTPYKIRRRYSQGRRTAQMRRRRDRFVGLLPT